MTRHHAETLSKSIRRIQQGMGAYQSVLDPRHVRIWGNLCALQSPAARLQMVETLLAGPEYVAAAKQAGVYGGILAWIAATRRGEYGMWPTVVGTAAPPTLRIHDVGAAPSRGGGGAAAAPPVGASQALARVPPPKRALDVLHESYAILSIDDTQPLTHETLRAAYKRAALRAHPDKGGSHEAFDAVTRAFTYLQEVLNKLLPKQAAGDGTDARFTAPVTADAALRARGMTPVAPAPVGTPRIADSPPVALNPKKLDMNVFNKLFEENRMPDPDADDGYGDWLKSQKGEAEKGRHANLRGKYNSDVFNKLFEEEARRGGADAAGGSGAVMRYTPPADLISAPDMGVELGGGRPAQYTKALGGKSSGVAYTDLKFAYGEGSTFSQNVSNVSLDGRPKTLEEAKREYGTAPGAMTAEQSAAVSAFDAARKAAEEQRLRRLAAHDVDAETMHEKMRSRLLIRN